MGFLKKLGKAVGGIAKKAAPFMSAIPGVGTVAGAITGGVGGLISGDGLKSSLGSAAKGAAGGLLGKAAGALGAGGKVGGLAKRAGDFISGGDGFDMGDLAQILKVGVPAVTGLAGMASSRKDSQASRDLLAQALASQQRGTDLAFSEFNKGEPLRDAARAGALNFFDPTNPFAINATSFVPGQVEPSSGGGVAQAAQPRKAKPRRGSGGVAARANSQELL